MAVMLPRTLDVRILMQVGDSPPIELGTLEAPGVTVRATSDGPRSELAFNPRKWRRSLRRALRLLARSI